MGQEIHITRVDDWSDGLITQQEWLRIIETDPDLVSQDADPLTAFWIASPDYDRTKPAAGWAPQLDYHNGKIECSLMDHALTAKACQIAAELNAFVLGDDTERYNPDGSISEIVDDEGNWGPHRERWDDPEFWREPTPEEIAAIEIEDVTHLFVPVWRQRLNIFLYQLRKRWWK